MKKLLAGVGISAGALLLSASPAFAHLCTNVNKKPGAGTYSEKVLPNGKEVVTGAWADIGAAFGIPECDGQETHIRIFLHQAASVGGDNGIQLLTQECRDAIEAFFGGE